MDRNGRISYANRKAEEELCLEEAEIKERAYDDPNWKITDLDGNKFPKNNLPFQKVKDTGKPVYDVNHAIDLPNGKRKFLSVNASPLFDNDGDFDVMVAVLENITEQIETQEKFREIKERATTGKII